MTEKRHGEGEPSRAEEAPYEPPRILWEDRLEQGAGLFAACAKLSPDGGTCGPIPGS